MSCPFSDPAHQPRPRRRGLGMWLAVLWLAGCGKMETVSPGRGVEREEGNVATVYPSGEDPREDVRHGLWRGMEGDRRVWEVRYTRGVPAGPYREWNAEGEMIATWPYDWEGRIAGWARWFEDGEPVFKLEMDPENPPDFDPLGRAGDLLEWGRAQADGETPEP